MSTRVRATRKIFIENNLRHAGEVFDLVNADPLPAYVELADGAVGRTPSAEHVPGWLGQLSTVAEFEAGIRALEGPTVSEGSWNKRQAQSEAQSRRMRLVP